MTGVHSLFPRGSFIGFDHLFTELEHVTRHANDHYPPHNIIKVDEETFLIELAVAGFSKDELDIQFKDRTLSVTGEHVTKGRDFIHRGISTKKFKRTFRLSEYVEIHGADLVDGVLAIDLKFVLPEEMRPRKINIGKSEEKNHDRTNTGTSQLLNETS